ncbi:hypothetical protein [Acinetobacter sp. BSP-28]|uniref:hypothetical protein n=1 Tax=Acinetobacter sp. BSP-28 TaxID=3344661 RepID=UPI003770593F
MVNINRPMMEADLTHPNKRPEEPRTDVHADPISDKESNRVPDMNEANDHPVGTSIGTVSGVAAGAALESAAGPAGAVVGGIIGDVVGNEAADAINPVEEDAYWREQHRDRPYFHETQNTYSDLDYDRDYRVAYEVGYKNRPLFDSDTHFEQVETELRTQWEAIKGPSRLDWEQAKYAAKDAWLRAPC